GDEVLVQGTVAFFNGLQLKNVKLIKVLNRSYVEGMEVYAELGFFEIIDGEKIWFPTVNYLDYPLTYVPEMDAYVLKNLHIIDSQYLRFKVVLDGVVTTFPKTNTALRSTNTTYKLDLYYSAKPIEGEFDLRKFFGDNSYPFKVVQTPEQGAFNS